MKYTFGKTLAEHRMRAYRKYLIDLKRVWNLQLTSHGKPRSKRILRSLVHYRGYVDSYLNGKREYMETVSVL